MLIYISFQENKEKVEKKSYLSIYLFFFREERKENEEGKEKEEEKEIKVELRGI